MKFSKKNTAVFIGHSDMKGVDLTLQIKVSIEELIEQGVNVFLNGGMGKFDYMCAECVNELKFKYENIKHYLIIPYAQFNWCDRTIFDGVLKPKQEMANLKQAIVYRNQWMISQSEYAICYVNNEFGGAFNTYKIAVSRNLSIKNLGTLK